MLLMRDVNIAHRAVQHPKSMVHIPHKPMMHIPIKFYKNFEISPYFHKIYKFPLLSFNLRSFAKFTFFASPYIDHDALHVLDAPGCT